MNRTVSALAVLAAAAAGCGTVATAAPLAGASASACSAKAPLSLPAQHWPAARARLAPPGAAAIRLCRYSGVNDHPPSALTSSRLIRSPRLVGALVDAFDRLPPFPPGAISCPNDDESEIAAVLAYPDGRQVTVTLDLAGCVVVTNGSVRRTAAGIGSPPAYGPQLVRRLERLVSPRPNPAGASALARGHWSVLARSPAGGGGHGSAVVWDGRELLELGARGAAYDPASARWRRVAAAPVGVAASVWTGRQVFVSDGAASAGLYDPAADRWSVTAPAPLDPLEQPIAVWTGANVFVAGLDQGRLEAAAYDPAGDRWRRLDPPIAPEHPPLGLAMVATRDGALLWSLWARTAGGWGVDVLRFTEPGGWTEVTGSWPQNHTVDQPVFTGTRVLLAPGQIWCGVCPHPAPLGEHGYTVDPATLRRTPIPHGPLDDLGPQIVWTGAAEISLNASGEITGPHVDVRPGDIAIFDPATGRWARGPRAPGQLGATPAVWGHARLYVLAKSGRLLAFGR